MFARCGTFFVVSVVEMFPYIKFLQALYEFVFPTYWMIFKCMSLKLYFVCCSENKKITLKVLIFSGGAVWPICDIIYRKHPLKIKKYHRKKQLKMKLTFDRNRYRRKNIRWNGGNGMREFYFSTMRKYERILWWQKDLISLHVCLISFHVYLISFHVCFFSFHACFISSHLCTCLFHQFTYLTISSHVFIRGCS